MRRVGVLYGRGVSNLDINGQTTEYDKDFWQTSLRLSPEVERGLDIIRPLWKKSSVPLMFLDDGNHGKNRGPVFKAGDWISLNEFGMDERAFDLIARISFGGNQKKFGDFTRYDNSEITRLHINVFGSRFFFPKEWESISEVPEDKREITAVTEKYHVSLRWFKDEESGHWIFDDWNDESEWVSGLPKSPKKENHNFNMTRTSYCISYPQKLHGSNSSEWMERELAINSINQIGRQNLSKIPMPEVSLDIDPEDMTSQQKNYGGGVYGRVPIVGFNEMKRYLPELTGLENRAFSMSPMEGVNFLFGRILPAIRKKVRKHVQIK